MKKRLFSFALICFFTTAPLQPADAHPGAAIVVDANGRVYFVDTGHGVWMRQRPDARARRRIRSKPEGETPAEHPELAAHR